MAVFYLCWHVRCTTMLHIWRHPRLLVLPLVFVLKLTIPLRLAHTSFGDQCRAALANRYPTTHCQASCHHLASPTLAFRAGFGYKC